MPKVRRMAYSIGLLILMAIAVEQPTFACESEERVQLDAPAKLSGVLKEGKASTRLKVRSATPI